MQSEVVVPWEEHLSRSEHWRTSSKFHCLLILWSWTCYLTSSKLNFFWYVMGLCNICLIYLPGYNDFFFNVWEDSLKPMKFISNMEFLLKLVSKFLDTAFKASKTWLWAAYPDNLPLKVHPNLPECFWVLLLWICNLWIYSFFCPVRFSFHGPYKRALFIL